MKVFSFFRQIVRGFFVIIKDVKENEKLKWLIWDLSGAHFIWVKIKPPPKEITDDKNYKPPTSFFIWVVGIYVAFFGLASQRYENRVDVIENRATAIFAQLSSSDKKVVKNALNRISTVQNMPCPYKPNIWKPWTVTFSMLYPFKKSRYDGILELLREAVENFKDSLDDINLSGAYLARANLQGVDLQKVDFEGANLQGANLEGTIIVYLKGADLGIVDHKRTVLRLANLSKAYLSKAYLEEANLQGVDLEAVNLYEANLKGANFQEANLEGAYFVKADLREVKNLNINQLCQVKTLFDAQLDKELEEQIKKKCPHLLEESSAFDN